MIVSKKLTLKTNGNGDTIDITPGVERALAEANLASGVVTLFVVGSTAALTTIEYEDGAVNDLSRALGPSISVPFVGGRLTLGTWQQIILIDFDTRQRQREIVAQIIGE
jgi:thiamine phosphate synthase YjbQ (UPF0047 family)